MRDWLGAMFRRDGTMYPEGDEGLLEWARDMANPKNKIVCQDHIAGYFISTVWLGLNYNCWPPFTPPLIFETMVFTDNDCEVVDRYATEDEAILGHMKTVDQYKQIAEQCKGRSRSERN